MAFPARLKARALIRTGPRREREESPESESKGLPLIHTYDTDRKSLPWIDADECSFTAKDAKEENRKRLTTGQHGWHG